MVKWIIKIAFCGALFFCGSHGLAAQDSGAFRRYLAMPDNGRGSSVAVTEHGTAADILSNYNNTKPRRQAIPGYRVRIFFSNSQTAREDAMAIQERFRTQFPSIPTYLVYETPSWMVTVGNCMNIDEFLILLGRVSRYYPSAFQWRGNIPINEFLKEGDAPEVRDEESPVAE